MDDETNRKVSEHVDARGKTQKRMLHILVISLALSGIVAFDLLFHMVPHGLLATVTRVSFPAVLLWSLTVTVYAFHTIWTVSQKNQELLQNHAEPNPEQASD